MQYAFPDLRRWAAAMFLVLSVFFAATTVGTAHAAEFDVYLKYGDFTWKEFDGRDRLLQESGALVGPGISYFREYPDHLTVNPKAELFVGDVNYDGQTNEGDPVKTDVTYVGLTLQGDVGRRFGENSYFEPFLGAGYRFWARQIENGRTASGLIATGYTEYWTSVYARLGMRGGVGVSESALLFAEVGVKLPVFNQNSIAQSGGYSQPNYSVRPGLQSSLFAELGVKMRNLKGSLFYDGMRFSRSEAIKLTDGVNIFSVVQPESRADIVGFTLGAAF